MKNTAIYIHIPFCDHKCIYCDFYSLISYENIESYLASIKKEVEHYSEVYSANRTIDTIFFGGGTPSFMEPKYIAEIISSIDSNFNLSPNAEITLETNPGTVSKIKFNEFKNAGINRISIGIQTFNDEELKFLTRIHNKQTAIETVKNAASAGFKNISIDLIFSLPNQTQSTWKENLDIAVNLPIKHISTYSLILERGTILNKMVLDGKIKMNNENHDADLYKFTMECLEENGFKQYEISNFAKDGFECRHNLYYWLHKDYLSFGTAAHSFIDGRRWWNFSSLKKYIAEIEQNGNAVRGEEVISKAQKLDEMIMLGLRSKGLDLELIESFSPNWYFEKKNIINSFIKERYLKESNSVLSCTKNGYMICDEIINKLL